MTLEKALRRTSRTGMIIFSIAHLITAAKASKIAEATLTPGTITLSTTHLRTEERTGHTVFQVSNSQFSATTRMSDRVDAREPIRSAIGGIIGMTISITSISAENSTNATLVRGSMRGVTALTICANRPPRIGNSGDRASITPSRPSPRTSTRGPRASIRPPTASSLMVKNGVRASSTAPTISPM